MVSATNYVARRNGMHSAMPAVTARRLCPHGIYLPPRIDHYAEVSRQIRGIFERFTPLVEPLSLDEAFLDVTSSENLFGPAVEDRAADLAGAPQRAAVGGLGRCGAQQVPGPRSGLLRGSNLPFGISRTASPSSLTTRSWTSTGIFYCAIHATDFYHPRLLRRTTADNDSIFPESGTRDWSS